MLFRTLPLSGTVGSSLRRIQVPPQLPNNLDPIRVLQLIPIGGAISSDASRIIPTRHSERVIETERVDRG